MIFGKAINRYYLKHAPVLLLGILSLLTVDYIQLLIPELYRLVINGVNLGQVVVGGQTLPFTREVLFQHICLPMIWIVVLMVIGRFLWRVCFFGSAVSVAADSLWEIRFMVTELAPYTAAHKSIIPSPRRVNPPPISPGPRLIRMTPANPTRQPSAFFK